MAALFSVLCFLSPLTQAATQITLGKGFEIRFDSGNFDTETFNMQITNLEVFKNYKRYWTADAVLLETTPLADGRTLIVKNLKIESFVSLVNKLKIGSIIVRNVTLDKYGHLLKGEIGSLSDHVLNNAYLGLFDVWMPIQGRDEYATFVQSIELTPVQLTTTPSGGSYLDRIGVRGVTWFKHRRLHHHNKVLGTAKIAADELADQLGLQDFQITFDLENVLIEDGEIMRSEMNGRVDIKNHFRMDMEFGVVIPLAAFWEIIYNADLKTVFTDEVGDEFEQSFFLNFLSSNAALSKFSLSVRDFGAFERFLNLHAKNSGQSITAAKEDIRAKLDQGIRENFPNGGLRLFPAIEEFFDHGGQLQLSMVPDSPAPFLLFANYFLMPERAIKQLNVTIEHLN